MNVLTKKPATYPINARRLAIPPPDWRSARAVYLVSSGRYATKKRHDPLTIRYAQFLRSGLKYSTDRGMRSLAKRQPDLFLAQRVAQEPTMRPLEIKARILARESDQAISNAVGLPVKAVASYIGLFFDVRERINSRGYIRWQVAGLALGQPPRPETLMLLSAYHHGPGVIPVWMDYFQHASERHDLESECGRNRAAIELLVEAHELPHDNKTVESLQKQLHLIQLKSPKTFKQLFLKGCISKNLDQMLGQIAWRVAENEEVQTAESEVADAGQPQILQFGKAG